MGRKAGGSWKCGVASSFASRDQKLWAQGLMLGAGKLRKGFAAALAAQAIRWPLFLPLFLGIGVALWFVLPFNAQRQAAALAAIAISASGFLFTGFARRFIIAAGLLICLGLAAADYRMQAVAPPLLYHRLTADMVTGTVLKAEPARGGQSTRLLLLRDARHDDPQIKVRITMRGQLPPDIRPGARVEMLARLAPIGGPVVPGAYDPARAAFFLGISAGGQALGPVRLLAKDEGSAGQWERWRVSLSSLLSEHMPAQSAAVAMALLVGEQGAVPADLLEAMRTSGLAHLLTVSGFHISVAVGGGFLLLRWLLALVPGLALRWSVRRIAAVGAASMGVGYAMLSGADVPAVRAAIIACVAMTAFIIGRDPLSLRLIAFAAFVILLLRPEALQTASFQLSFAAVIAIALLIHSPFYDRYLRKREEDGILFKAARLIGTMVLTGLAVELVLTPLALAHFGRAGLYGAVANLIAIPLTSLLIMPLLALAVPLLALGLEWPAALAGWSIDLLAGVALEVADWPGASVGVPAIPSLAFGLGIVGSLLGGLLVGRAKVIALPFVVVAAAIAIFGSRPNLFLSQDARQLAIVQEGQLFTWRGHRSGYQVAMWEESSQAVADRRLAGLAGAECAAWGCRVALRDFTLLALEDERPLPSSMSSACAAADLVVTSGMAPRDCYPRWMLLDVAALAQMGAATIDTDSRKIRWAAQDAGDRPWSPSALPGVLPRLLGEPTWIGLVAE